MRDLAFFKGSNLKKRKNPQDLLRRREGLIGLFFLSPWIVGFIVLKLAPIVGSSPNWFGITTQEGGIW